MNLRHFAVAAIAAATATAAQQPFALDPNFHFSVGSIAVGDVLERPDGKIIVSGNMLYPDLQSQWAGGLLEANGAIIPSPPGQTPLYNAMGGRIVPWGEDMFYVEAGPSLQRFWMDGTRDTSFQNPPDPLLSGLSQWGDFHIYPDGRILLAGNFWLKDTLRGFVGFQYGLVWLNTDGSLDTTRIHRSIGGPNGALHLLKQLPDGKFLCGGGSGMFEGSTVSTLFRVNGDGSLDTSFNAPFMDWGEWDCMLPQTDGKVIVSGRWRFTDGPDVSLVRFLPNGQIDPSFNNGLDFGCTYNASSYWPIVSHVEPIGEGMLAITGWFDRINGEVHGGIAMIDTAGNLLPGYFAGNGCGGFNDQIINPTWRQNILGMEPAQDGGYFIYGAYHGYDDGTTNDPGQRLLSKLYGLNVGISEHEASTAMPLAMAPNPAHGAVQLSVGAAAAAQAMLTIHDASGRQVLQEPWPAGAHTHTLQAGALAPGTYMVRVASGAAATAYTGRLVVLP